jgi:hypothetical protein
LIPVSKTGYVDALAFPFGPGSTRRPIGRLPKPLRVFAPGVTIPNAQQDLRTQHGSGLSVEKLKMCMFATNACRALALGGTQPRPRADTLMVGWYDHRPTSIAQWEGRRTFRVTAGSPYVHDFYFSYRPTPVFDLKIGPKGTRLGRVRPVDRYASPLPNSAKTKPALWRLP